jgi:hypothetical protein
VITRDEAVRLAEEQRAKQGLPPRIEDVSVLQRIATIMRPAERSTRDPRTRQRKRKP